MALEDAANEVDVALTRDDPKGLAFENVFSGIPSFLRRKLTKNLAGIDLAVTGIPFDQAVTHRPGARFGPRSCREASTLLAGDPPFGWGFSPLEDFAIADAGDMAFDYANTADVPRRIEAHVADIIGQGPGCLSLGGDHSITLPILRAHVARYGPLALLQFDAHSDTWVDDDPARIDHGTFVYKAVQEGLIDTDHSVQVGIRVENEPTLGIERIDARSVHHLGPEAIAERIHARIGGAKTYLTFDIDTFDPSAAPGTGTPVWEGLTSAQVAPLLRGLAGLDIAGMDVVELSPGYDHANMTSILAAHVAYELICLWCWTRR